MCDVSTLKKAKRFFFSLLKILNLNQPSYTEGSIKRRKENKFLIAIATSHVIWRAILISVKINKRFNSKKETHQR